MRVPKHLTAILAIACFSIPAGAQQNDADLKAAFERCAEIQDEIAAIRQLNFTNKVEVKLQTQEEFVKYVEKEINEQYGSKEEVDSYIDALVLLGALKEKVEFADTLKEMMISQAAAHYDPRNNIYYLLMGDASPFLLDVISSHELCHALQDQHFDLTKLIMDNPKAVRDNGDAATAIQCIAEGDATLVMTWWAMAKQMPGTPEAQMSAQVSLAAGVQAVMDFDMIKSLASSGMAGSEAGFGSIAGSIEDLDKFPRYFMEALLMAYTQGAVAVDRVRTEGGWKAVNNLYTKPPTSTEQILHPEKLLGERDEPVDVRLKTLTDSPPKGWKLAEEDVLGELGTRILFSTWNDPAATNRVNPTVAARGWDGDRYYYLTKDKEELLAWKTVWDTQEDAAKFARSLPTMLKAKYPGLTPAKSSDPDSVCFETRDGRRLLMKPDGNSVLFLNLPAGFDSGSLLKQIE